MARIVIAWELGSGYGHVSMTRPVATALRARGHEVAYIVRDLARAQTVLRPGTFPLLPAPIWLRSGGRPPLAHSYADILLRSGYAQAGALAGLVHGWEKLFTLLAPDLLLADHAPTAVLAGRLREIPTALVGMPYGSPPRVSPLPELQPWDPVPESTRLAAEETTLASANAVLDAGGHGRLERLADLFAVEADFLCAFMELDCYGPRMGAWYCGPTGISFSRDLTGWPEASGPRLLVVLDASYWDLENLLAFLGRCGMPTLASIRDVTSEQIARHATATLKITGMPLDVATLLHQADAVISNGSLNVLHATLLAGKPTLILPLQLDSVLTGSRAAETGAVVMVGLARDRPHDYASLIEPLLSDPACAAAARAFAARHAGHDPVASGMAIADRCEALLARDGACRA